MKLWTLVLVLLVAAVPVLLLTGALDQRVANAQGEGAVVINDAVCLIPGEFFGPGLPSQPLSTSEAHAVITPSGNVSLVCHFELPVGPPKTVTFDDFPCSAESRPATKSHVVFNENGKVHLVCQAHPENQP